MARSQRWAVVTSMVALVAWLLAAVPSASADPNTGGGGLARNGWSADQTGPTAAAVAPATFGRLFSTAVDGQVYAQPVVWNGTVVVATENDTVAGIDAATGAVRWSRHLGTPWNSSDIGCGDIAPTVGVTGTPVVDPSTGTAYLVTKSYVSGDSGPSRMQLHALDITTGLDRPGWPVLVAGTAANDPSSVFAPETLVQRPALLLLGGVVYAAFGGFCDTIPWQGWIAGVSTATARLTTLWTTAVGGAASSIWQSGAGLASDGAGQILFATGNGITPPVEPGKTQPPPGDLGQSVVRVAVQSDGSLRATDFFAPKDADALNDDDLDQGSGGVAVLPDSFGTAVHAHLLVQGGKTGTLYLLDRDQLGGQGQGSGGSDASVQDFGGNGGIWATPAVWPGDGGFVYVPTVSSAAGDPNGGRLYAYQRSVDSSGDPAFTLAGASAANLGYGSSSAAVSSDGTTDGSAVVWIVDKDPVNGDQLEAYGAVPTAGILPLLWSAPVGTASKFEPPTVAGGRLYLGTGDGHLLAFGPTAAVPPLTSPDAVFPTTDDGNTSQVQVTLTASRPVTITSLSTTDARYTAGPPSPPVGTLLGAGDTVTVPVTFAPVASGTDDASLVVTSSDGSVSTVSLTGSGADAPGAPVASSPQLDFGVLGVGGAPASLDADFTNNGTDPVVVTGTLSPGAPFSVPSPPAVGEVIAPGAALDLPLSFAPPGTSGAWAGTVTLLTDHGAVSVSVAGATDVGGPAASFSSDNIALGAVDETGRPERTLAVTDTGTTDLVVTGWPAGPDQGFAAASAGGGITVFPGQTVEETITFTPPAVGNFATNWHLTANDGTTVNLTLSAIVVPAGTVPDPALGGWQLNGTARQNGPVLDLTEVGQFGAAGSAFWPTPVDSAGLDVTFTSTIGGGGGADGLTLTFADPASAGPGSLGGFGGGLGYAGVAGVAVALDTYPFDQVAVADGSSQGLPTWVASTTNVPDLHQGTHQVEVQVTPGEVTVRLDGSVVLTAAVSLPRQVLLGFTGGSGGFDDEHGVSGVDILTDAGAVPPGLPEVPWAPILLVVPAGALLLAARRQVRPRRGRQPRGQ